MKLIRTFHPIGQGAFYTERFNFSKDDFTVVYDCGSLTFREKKMEKIIKSTFPKNHSIDILFISHFHADHINGIEILAKHCKIQKVIMPLIDNQTKILVKVANLIGAGFSDTRLIDSPENIFGDIPIIRIDSTKINPNFDGVSLNNPIDISKIESSSTNQSGIVFTPISGVDWFFIPFNYKHEERKNQFEDELKTLGLTFDKIDTINKINKNKVNITKAYNRLDGDLNENSMILYSGKKSDDSIHCFNNDNYLYLHRHFNFQCGCLYMGDIDLNVSGIVSDIEVKLRPLLPYIGTLQVPHHGSIHNFNISILQKSIHCAIFSYGTTNSFGHPSDRVIGDIISNFIYPYHVTEKKESIIVQWK